MSDPDNFLSRWSRRKLEPPQESAEKDVPQQEQSSITPPDDAAARSEAAPPEAAATDDQSQPFDVSSLPPIESITANTDIRDFLKPGVPLALSQAALRRMWSSDPAIRDFIEIAENQWDFTNNSIPGFGSVDPADIPRLLAEMMGKAVDRAEAVSEILQEEPETAKSAAQDLVAVRQTDETAEPQNETAAPDAPAETQPHDSEDGAAQKEEVAQDVRKVRRGHGSALPT